MNQLEVNNAIDKQHKLMFYTEELCDTYMTPDICKVLKSMLLQ